MAGFTAVLIDLGALSLFQAKADEAEEAAAEEGEDEDKLAPIDIGDSLPTLTLKNEKDEDVQIATLASEKGVVLFLVPKADTRKYRSKRFLWIPLLNNPPRQRAAPRKLAVSAISTPTSHPWISTCTA